MSAWSAPSTGLRPAEPGVVRDAGPANSEPAHAQRISAPYLLVVNIPGTVADGEVGVTPLWAKDLAEHTEYIERLTLAAPASVGPARPGDIGIPVGGPRSLADVVQLPDSRSLLHAILLLPKAIRQLWRAVGRSQIVHCGMAGWPIPYGWIAAPIAVLRGRFLIVLIESAPWRPSPGEKRSLKRRVQAWLYESMAAWSLRRADLALVTHAMYARTLAPRRTRPTHVLHASWIDERNILSDPDARRQWGQKLARPGPLRVVFAGRLEAAKGVEVLLEAMALLERSGAPVHLDVYGEGELLPACERAQADRAGSVQVRARGVLPYGDPFFAALREADVMVVPSLSDEQPRIAFDAFSQAVPVLGSDTAGLRDCVADGLEGVLIRPGDAAALARSITELCGDRPRLAAMGLAGLQRARSLTHREMHRRRCGYILAALGGRKNTDDDRVEPPVP